MTSFSVMALSSATLRSEQRLIINAGSAIHHTQALAVNRDRDPSSDAIFLTGLPGAKIASDLHPPENR